MMRSCLYIKYYSMVRDAPNGSMLLSPDHASHSSTRCFALFSLLVDCNVVGCYGGRAVQTAFMRGGSVLLWLQLLVLLEYAADASDTESAAATSSHGSRQSHQWELTWSEEFSGNSLNSSRWRVRNNESHCCDPFGRYELELYVAEAVRVHDGYLELNTKWNPQMGPAKHGTNAL